MFVVGLPHSVDVSAVVINIAGNICSEMSGKLRNYQCSVHFYVAVDLFPFYVLLAGYPLYGLVVIK